MGINTATLSGNVGAEPEIKHFESGSALASFNLAVAGWDGKAKAKKTIWITCKGFNKTCELIAGYVSKGSTVTVSGQLDVEEWTTQSGEKRSRTVLIVRDIQLPAKSSGPVTTADLVADDLDASEIPF